MPWKETCVMDQKAEFVSRLTAGEVSMSELCREFGISRKTGHKWKKRFYERGVEGLHDHSRRPASCSEQLNEDVVCRIVALKQAHPSWGARKLRAVMLRSREGLEVPSESSFKRVLNKSGLVRKRRRRLQQDTGRLQLRVKSERVNQVWTIDFKGWWRTQDRGRFEPLTIRDDYSRYVLFAAALPDTGTEWVRRAMEEVFARYGLPEVIRSDNGAPFAAWNSPFGLTRLSAWWLSLGIDLDRICPGKPQENGGHERMHRDMLELEHAAALTPAEQQAGLDVWRATFNEERPHEALGMRVPAEVYERSCRAYDPTAVELSYPAGYVVRRVSGGGQVKIRNVRIGVSVAIAGFQVGLESLDAMRYGLWFGRIRLGEIDLRTERFRASVE